MTNFEISKIIYDSDKTGNLRRSAIIHGQRINNGIYSFDGIEHHKELLILLVNLASENYRITQKDIQMLKKYNIILPISNNIEKTMDKSFIAVSDFHGYRYPLEKIKKDYLNKYDVIYIMGDATDRGEKLDGTGGIQLLIDIMHLTKQYPDRVIYVPGNHDEFLLGHIRRQKNMDSYYPYSYLANLIYNGGLATINEIKALEVNNPNLYNELVSWLGSRPLQRTHRYNGKEFVLGHAIFNQRLYNINPDYTLENYFREPQNSENRRMASQVLWFRKMKDIYLPTEMPSSDKIMVIGHTPESKRRNQNINLNDANDNIIKVHCVDGGIAYNGFMLEYDGGYEVRRTTYLTFDENIDTPNKTRIQQAIENQNKFHSHILSKIIKEEKKGFYEVLLGDKPKELSESECQKIVDKCVNTSINLDVKQKRSIYIKTFLFNYILENQIIRMQEQNYDTYTAVAMIDTFLFGNNNKDYITVNGNDGKGNYKHITSTNYTRKIVTVIGPQTLIEVLHLYGCQTVKEYIERTQKPTDNISNRHKR